MKKETFIITDIEDYQNRLTEKQKEYLIKHCNAHEIKPEICAWYDNMEDFYSDWVNGVGYSKDEAKSLLVNNDGGEFKKFKDGSIVRLNR